MSLRCAHIACKSQVDTWTETLERYIRFYDKQNEVRFYTFEDICQKLRFSVTIQLRTALNIDLTVFCDEKCFSVFYPITDLSVGVQTAMRVPFVSLFQVFTAEEGERWSRSKGFLKRSS